MSVAVAPAQLSNAPPASPSPRRRRRMVIAWLFALLALAGSAVLAVAVFRPAAAQPSTTLPLATARRGDFLVTVTCRGELVAEDSVQIIAPNVPNLTIVWMAPPNSAVKEGDPVVRFDASGAQRQLKEKEAALAQAVASADQAKAEAGITVEQDRLEIASLEQAVELAKIEVSKSQILSAIQAEDNRITLALAEEKLRVKQAAAVFNAASAQSKIASAESQRKKADAEVQLIRERIARTEIRAPGSGVINYLMNYSQGWMNAKPFKVGDNVWPGSAVAEIPNLESLRLKGKTEEIDRGRMSAGQDVRVILDPFPEKTFAGKLDRISPLTEQSWEWPPTRSFRAYATLGETDNRLRPQMNGRMDITVDRIPNAISVPSKAVFARDGKPVVLVPGKDGVRAVPIELLARNPDEVAIRGIEAGTQVALVDNPSDERKKGESK
ncbi:MAG TPA: HlyD family efflux transporter periplasmic adaptor subunit [Bryobacteraceae bacterium]|nr:HlyD family efflux transporter periplasmic adaptor subunit [Bryobacteraceae bacterium]